MSPHALRQERYREWLTAQGLRFGFAGEIADYASRVHDGVTNDTPPFEVWHRILPTVRVAERLREKFGPTVVRSAYRSPSYNATFLDEGGAVNSQHIQNTALDLACATGTPAEWAAELRRLRAGGAFLGGIGVYRTFVHADSRGTHADWRG